MSSDRIDQLDWSAEVFYRRLMSKVDDHGLYDARPSMLRSSLYPLKVDRVREADISRWMAACQKAGLIVLYEADGKPYLQMTDTKWERRGKPKYPLPNDSHLETSVNNTHQVSANFPVVEGVVVFDSKALSGKPDDTPLNGRNYTAEARDILDYLNRATGRGYRHVDSNLKPIVARLKSGVTPTQVREVVFAKCEQWGKDEKMMTYLRPETLFRASKFEQYLGEMNGMPAVQG